MSKTNFNEKTKNDLVAIARLSGVLSTSVSQRMSKAELVAYLEEAERNKVLAQLDSSVSDKKTRGRPASPGRRKNSPVVELQLPLTAAKAADPAPSAANEPAEVAARAEVNSPATQQQSSKEEALRKSVFSFTKEARARIMAEQAETTAKVQPQTQPQVQPPAQAKAQTQTQAQDRTKSRGQSKKPTINSGRNITSPLATSANTVLEESTKEANNLPASAVEQDKTEKRAVGRPKKEKALDKAKGKPGRKPKVLAPLVPAETAETSQPLPSKRDLPKSELGGSEPVRSELIKSDRSELAPPEPTQALPKTGRAKPEAGKPAPHAKASETKEAQVMTTGILEIMPDGYGFLRTDNYIQNPKDVYLPPQYIRRFNLRTGDQVTGPCRQQREGDKYQALFYIKEVNGMAPDKMIRRPHFDRLTPIYPDERFLLETHRTELSTRIIDLIAPIGKGQRGMIVSPPKAGKTILLQKIANAISENNPQAKLIVLLIDERPEEVTDMQRSIKGEVVYSTFDKTPENHVRITELVLERAERLVELGEDVIILLDSITRMGRAYNLTINPTGRTLSGGLDPGALYGPKRFFGAARNIEGGGSLTIIATALVETGSRMDEVIFEEFKGTGNMEVCLDRKLSEKRIFPAIDINRSGTRREELLLSKNELEAVWGIRKAFNQLDTAAVTETIISLLLKTQNNSQFISSINVSFNDKTLFEAMRGSMPGGSRPNGQNNSRATNGQNAPSGQNYDAGSNA